MLEHAVGKCSRENRAKIAIEAGVIARQRIVEGQRWLVVIADAVHIIASGTKEAIHLATVVLCSASVIRVSRIGMWASGVIGCKGISRMRNALHVHVGEASLLSVRIWQPSEQMIEAAVLHHHKNYVVDRGA